MYKEIHYCVVFSGGGEKMDNDLIIQQLDNGCVNIMCLQINIMQQLKVMFMEVAT